MRRQDRLQYRSSRVTSLNLRSYNSNKPPSHTASGGKHRRYPRDEPCSLLPRSALRAGSSPGKVSAGCSRRDKEPNCALCFIPRPRRRAIDICRSWRHVRYRFAVIAFLMFLHNKTKKIWLFFSILIIDTIQFFITLYIFLWCWYITVLLNNFN